MPSLERERTYFFISSNHPHPVSKLEIDGFSEREPKIRVRIPNDEMEIRVINGLRGTFG